MPRLSDPRHAPDCTIEVDGAPVAARAGESVAAALVAVDRFVVGRSPKYHRPRGAFCLAGSCHSCLARVDGLPNQRLCRVLARPGLSVSTQNALPTAAHDLLATIDRVFPRHLDHHHLVTWSGVANRAMIALSRQLAGTGTLPDGPPPPVAPAAQERFEAVVVGGGPAGLAAAEVLAGRGVLLAESERVLGGRLRCALPDREAPGPTWPAEVARAVARAGGEAAAAHTVVGIWKEGDASLVVLRPEGATRLRLVRARRVVLATGTHALPPVFPCNDLPGIFAGRAVARLLAEDGIVPGRRCVVAGGGDERALVAEALRAAGVEVASAGRVARAVGRDRVRAVVLEEGRTIRCDALVWCGPRGPAWDLARALGAEAERDAQGGWTLRAGEGGGTSVPGLLVAGEVVAPMSVAAAVAAGRRAAEAAGAD